MVTYFLDSVVGCDSIIVVEGLSDNDRILLSPPDNLDKIPYEFLEPSIAEAANEMLNTWKKEKEEYDKVNAASVKGNENQNTDFGGGNVFFF